MNYYNRRAISDLTAKLVVLLITLVFVGCSDDDEDTSTHECDDLLTSVVTEVRHIDWSADTDRIMTNASSAKLSLGVRSIEDFPSFISRDSIYLKGTEMEVNNLNIDTTNNNLLFFDNCNNTSEELRIDFQPFIANNLVNESNGSISGSFLVSSPTMVNRGKGDIHVTASGLNSAGLIGNVTLENESSGSLIVIAEAQGLTNNKAAVINSGSGDILIDSYQIQEFDIEIAGDGDVYIWVNSFFGKINAEIEGAGNIYFKGTPFTIEKKGDGTGEIIDNN